MRAVSSPSGISKRAGSNRRGGSLVFVSSVSPYLPLSPLLFCLRLGAPTARHHLYHEQETRSESARNIAAAIHVYGMTFRYYKSLNLSATWRAPRVSNQVAIWRRSMRGGVALCRG